MDVNLKGPFLLTKAAIPQMRRGGAIVTIGSWYGQTGHAFFSAYCASKAGLIVYTQCLAGELAPAGIRANCVCPGNINTGMHRHALEAEAATRGIGLEEMRDIEWAKIPLGIAGPPEYRRRGRPVQFLDVTRENWDTIMTVNDWGVLLCTQEAVRRMIAQGTGGKIINTTSMAGRQAFPPVAPYCSSKFAVIALTQAAARAFAEHDITVNGFAPGVVETPLWEKLDLDLMEIGESERPGQAIEDFSAVIIRGRKATPDDITGTALFLASSDSDYMTGQIVMIDGGMALV